jgi:hypothetical protein
MLHGLSHEKSSNKCEIICLTEAKCKQSSILTSIQNTKPFNCTYCQEAIDEKVNSGTG